MPSKVLMGKLHWLTRRMSAPPICVHFDSEVVRMMQMSSGKKPSLHMALEVSRDDEIGMKEALNSFKGKECIISIPASDVLVQHIRVSNSEDESEIKSKLTQQSPEWENCEVRHVCVAMTGVGTGDAPKQELLCVGVNGQVAQKYVQELEAKGAHVLSVTVPLHASLRAFDKLYRRDGDEKITSMLIDLDEQSSIIMVAHGSHCVFARQLALNPKKNEKPWQTPVSSEESATPDGEFERRQEQAPRGLYEMMPSNTIIDGPLEQELRRCLQHHDALFPQRAVDRIIFSGSAASDTETCAAIASNLGVAGYIADPSAWIDGAEACASGPSWTTAAGMCLRFSKEAA